MTAPSELFVTEDIRDEVAKILKRKDVTIEVPDGWKNIWSDNEYPNEGEAMIIGNQGKYLGKVTWDVKFSIEYDGEMSRYIVAEPENIEVSPNITLRESQDNVNKVGRISICLMTTAEGQKKAEEIEKREPLPETLDWMVNEILNLVDQEYVIVGSDTIWEKDSEIIYNTFKEDLEMEYDKNMILKAVEDCYRNGWIKKHMVVWTG